MPDIDPTGAINAGSVLVPACACCARPLPSVMRHFMARKNPQQKTFKLPWGSGVVEEEVQIEAKYHMPTVQLLRFTEGQAKGTLEVRFCHYDHEGRFQRSPLIIDAHDLPGLGRALREAPKLLVLLSRMITPGIDRSSGKPRRKVSIKT